MYKTRAQANPELKIKAELKLNIKLEIKEQFWLQSSLFELLKHVNLDYTDHNMAKFNVKFYNIVAMWPRHMISLVIIFSDISLSPTIALTNCLVPDGSLFQYTKPHSSIVGNRLSYIALLRNLPAAIPFVGKRSHRHSTIFPFVGKGPSLIWFHWGSKSSLIALQLRANDLVII